MTIPKACELTTDVLKMLDKEAKIGVSTFELDKMAHDMIITNGGIPYNKGYKPSWSATPFPFTICTNVNSMIAHGFPSEYKLQDGDIVSFDVGIKKDNVCGDSAFTKIIGTSSSKGARLLRVAREALERGKAQVKDGAYIRAIGYAIQSYVLREGFVVNEHFIGHGIGTEMHEDPQIPHFFNDLDDRQLKAGMMICLEPMVTKKDYLGVFIDEWQVKTKDDKPSAFFEEQLLVTEDNYQLLTTHL